MTQAYQRQAGLQKRDDLIVSHLPLVKHIIGRLVGELPRDREKLLAQLEQALAGAAPLRPEWLRGY